MVMHKIAIAVHGGAGPDTDFIKEHLEDYKKGIEAAIAAGYDVLDDSGTSLDAVEAAVKALEDNPLFNAGRGSALNNKGEVEMDAAIMNGKDMRSGAVAIVKNTKNPVELARAVMENTSHIYLGAAGALEFAQQHNVQLMPEAYFITTHTHDQFLSTLQQNGKNAENAAQYRQYKTHGTVGAVALDRDGNIAAATSTGGTENRLAGRIADSSMIGIGCYANNAICAVSTTGDGEPMIKNVIGFQLAALIKYKGLSLNEACRYLVHEELKDEEGDIGIIAIDASGNIAMEFNAERMHRGYRTAWGEQEIKVYGDSVY
jgi:beta-aspartyl-peptidase (threonine type)